MLVHVVLVEIENLLVSRNLFNNLGYKIELKTILRSNCTFIYLTIEKVNIQHQFIAGKKINYFNIN